MKDSKAVHELIAEGGHILEEGQNAQREAWEQDVVKRLEYERSSQSWYVNCMKVICNNKVKPYQIPLIIMLLDGKEGDPNPVYDMPVCMSTTVVMFEKSLILLRNT